MKRITVLLSSLIMVLCHGTLCFGESPAQIALAHGDASICEAEYQPAPIVLDFAENMAGITSGEINLMSISLENGSLKCVSTPIISGGRVTSGYIYLPLDNIDGEYYNRFKMTAKVDSAGDATLYRFALYYRGANKLDGTVYTEAEARATKVSFTNLTESGGKFSNTEYQEYVVDLSAVSKWSESNVNTLRIDPLKDASGTLYIDKIEFYNETSGTQPEEPANPADPPDENDPATDEDEFLEYAFDSDTEGFIKMDGKVTLTVQDGALKYVSEAAYDGSGKASSGNMTKDVTYDIGQYYMMEMKVKLDGVAPTFNGGNAAPRYAIYYNGRDAAGNAYGISSARQLFGNYLATFNEDDGKYYSDWHTVIVDFGKLTSWEVCAVDKLRIDVIKDAEGTIYIDYIKLFSVPLITGITFDGKDNVTDAVPVNTKTIIATLSQGIFAVGAKAVSIYNAEGVAVDIESVKYDTDKNTVTATVNGLDMFTDYTFEINKNAMANSKQNLYKSTVILFKTEAGELEYNAAGNGNSAEMSFANKNISPKTVLLIATIWDDNKYVDKLIKKHSVNAGETTYIFDYSSVIGGSKAEITVWEYSDGVVKKVYGKKVYTFER